jgi:hypothetical protein
VVDPETDTRRTPVEELEADNTPVAEEADNILYRFPLSRARNSAMERGGIWVRMG